MFASTAVSHANMRCGLLRSELDLARGSPNIRASGSQLHAATHQQISTGRENCQWPVGADGTQSIPLKGGRTALPLNLSARGARLPGELHVGFSPA